MNIARAMDRHGLFDLVFKIAQVGHRGGRDIGNLMCHGNLRHIFTLTKLIAGVRAHDHGGGGTRSRWGSAGALHTGVHVGLVVIADIEHIVIAFEHPRQAAKTDVGRAAVAALRNHSDIAATFGLHRRSDTGGHRCSITKQRVNPRHLPRRFRIGRGENFQATGCIGGNQLPIGGRHGGIYGIACAQCFTTALTRPMARIEGIAAFLIGLHTALIRCEQTVAYRERAGLIKLDC
ncbi:hypothetical protein GALL_475770 [mine drainage metagenome]|uniref:Uncharacterized protein n=1 Tax=mine drainage metagenome TaxID=410659 RepID=A0A1J5PGT0_9ZZZZ